MDSDRLDAIRAVAEYDGVGVRLPMGDHDWLVAEVERLRALLAEPDDEEVWRMACLAGAPANAYDGRVRVTLVRRLLAGLRKRAEGGTP